MRVLVTRPREDCAATAARLRLLGHEPVEAPLLAVRFLDGAEIPLEGVQALLFTSANGVRALARRTPRRDLPVFAVGPQTSEEARKAGFATVRDAKGDAKALAAATRNWASPGKGALLHARGAQAGGALATMLREAGHDVRSEALYEVEAASDLPPGIAGMFRAGRIDAALFFSPRSAGIFRDCAMKAGLDVSRAVAVCIGKAAADALAPLVFRRTRIAREPNQDALFDCLD